MARARHDEQVTVPDVGLGHGVSEVLAAPLDADDGDPVLGAQRRLGKGPADRFSRRFELDDGEAIVELDVVDQATRQQMGGPLAGVALGIDDVPGPDPLQDAPVSRCDGLGPHLTHAEVDQDAGAEQARLDVVADGDHGDVELLGPELTHGVLVGGVGLSHVLDLA